MKPVINLENTLKCRRALQAMPEQGLQLSDNGLWQEIEDSMAPGHGDRAAAGASLADLDAGRAQARIQSSLLRAPGPVVAALNGYPGTEGHRGTGYTAGTAVQVKGSILNDPCRLLIPERQGLCPRWCRRQLHPGGQTFSCHHSGCNPPCTLPSHPF